VYCGVLLYSVVYFSKQMAARVTAGKNERWKVKGESDVVLSLQPFVGRSCVRQFDLLIFIATVMTARM